MTKPISKKYSEGDEIGIHKIVKVTGIKKVSNRNIVVYDMHYMIQCALCGNIRETTQQSLRNGGTGPSYYCYYCPPELKIAGKKKKKQERDRERRYGERLTSEEKRLYKLALFGRLA